MEELCSHAKEYKAQNDTLIKKIFQNLSSSSSWAFSNKSLFITKLGLSIVHLRMFHFRGLYKISASSNLQPPIENHRIAKGPGIQGPSLECIIPQGLGHGRNPSQAQLVDVQKVVSLFLKSYCEEERDLIRKFSLLSFQC